MSDRDTPTCEYGFWAQITEGCPLCHPGPCKLGYNLPRHQPFADTQLAMAIRFWGVVVVLLVALALIVGLLP
jgi:hypothetical protein